MTGVEVEQACKFYSDKKFENNIGVQASPHTY